MKIASSGLPIILGTGSLKVGGREISLLSLNPKLHLSYTVSSQSLSNNASKLISLSHLASSSWIQSSASLALKILPSLSAAVLPVLQFLIFLYVRTETFRNISTYLNIPHILGFRDWHGQSHQYCQQRHPE